MHPRHTRIFSIMGKQTPARCGWDASDSARSTPFPQLEGGGSRRGWKGRLCAATATHSGGRPAFAATTAAATVAAVGGVGNDGGGGGGGWWWWRLSRREALTPPRCERASDPWGDGEAHAWGGRRGAPTPHPPPVGGCVGGGRSGRGEGNKMTWVDHRAPPVEARAVRRQWVKGGRRRAGAHQTGRRRPQWAARRHTRRRRRGRLQAGRRAGAATAAVLRRRWGEKGAGERAGAYAWRAARPAAPARRRVAP